VALADDFFTFAADAAGEQAASGTEETAGTDPSSASGGALDDLAGGGAPRRSGSSRMRKASEKVSDDEGRLAAMVRELRDLEDDMQAGLASAERLFAQLESRRTYEDGGYASADEFEHRLLAAAPTLRALREAVPPGAARARLSVARRDAGDARARQNRALTAMARALDRVRALDAAVHRSASAARTKLHVIETQRVYAECGYVSFEEFLERALGPSPLLASAVALLADEPLAVAPDAGAGARVAADDPTTPVDAQEFPDFFSGAAAAEGAAPSDSDDGAAAPGAPEPADGLTAESTARKRGVRWAVSIALCVVAAVGGAAAGIRTGEHDGPGASGASSMAPAASTVTAHEPGHAAPPPAREPRTSPQASAAEPAPKPSSLAPARAISSGNPANAEGKRAPH